MRSVLKRSLLCGLLLQAILFRALIPVGFMPAPGADGGLSVIFCAAVGGAHGPAHAHHHGHDGATEEGHGSGHAQYSCPFAASAGLAPLPDFSVPAPAQADLFAPAGVIGTRQFVPTILRAQSPRAPPGVA
jgi:hypothetical protein